MEKLLMAFMIMGFVFLIDSMLFLVGLFWLRSSQSVTLWKSVIYLTLMAGISMPFFMVSPELAKNLVNTFAWIIFFLITTLFAVVSAFLWEKLFKATSRQSWEYGILVGLVNAALCIANIPVIKW